MNNSLLIIGAGGHGRSIAALAEELAMFSRINFIDDNPSPALQEATRGKLADFDDLINDYTHAIVGVGNNHFRKQWHDKIAASPGLTLATLIHPRAVVGTGSTVGSGTVIFAGVVIGVDVTIGHGVIINANSTLDHDCLLDNFAHIGVGVHLAGNCHIAEYAFLQAGTCGAYNAYGEANVVYPAGSVLKPEA